MSLKNIIESLSNNKINLESKSRDLVNQKTDDIPNIYISLKENDDLLNHISSNIINKISDRETLFKYADLIKSDDKEIETLRNDFEKDKDEQAIKNFIRLKLRMEPLESFNKIEDLISDKDKDEIEASYKSYTPITKRKRDYIYKNEDLLNNANSKDNKYKNELNYIKESIFKQRNAEDHDLDAGLAEETIRNKKIAINHRNAKVCDNDPYFSKYIEYQDVVTFTYKGGQNNIKDKKELDTELKKREINIPKDKQDILVNAFNKLESMKNYQTGESLLDLKSYQNEEGVKIYAFKNFANLYYDTEEALKNNDLDKAKELVNIHKKETKEMDSLISDLSKLGNNSYPSNISCARSENLPVEYEENYKEASNVNGLWHALAFFKVSKLDPKEFLKKPVETYLNYLDKNEGLPEIEELGEKGDIDFIKNITDNKQKSLVGRTIGLKYNNFRAFEFIASVDNDGFEKNMLTYQYMKQIKMNTPYIEKYRASNDIFMNAKAETIKNVLLNQDKSIKYATLMDKNYNSKEYLKNNDIDSKKLLEKLESAKEACKNGSFNGKEKEIELAVTLAAKEAITNKNLLNTNEFNKLCELSGTPTYKAIREVSGTRDIAKFVKDGYDKQTKDGINKDNVTLAANSLKAISDQYKKRGFFGRIFRSEARAENRLINQIKADCKAAGISDKEIEGFEKGNIETEAFKETSKTNSRVLLNIKSLDEDLVATNNEKNLGKDLALDLDKDLENDSLSV